MKRLAFIGALIGTATLFSLVAYSRHCPAASRCALDGILIEPLYEVIIIDEDGTESSFSCVISAQIWLQKNCNQPISICVTDESTGDKIPAEDAYYVESEQMTTPHTANAVHVFARKAEAELHARQFNGKFIKKPFKTHPKKPDHLETYIPEAPNKTCFLPSYPRKPLCFAWQNVLFINPYCSGLFPKHPNRLPDGYSDLPDKPPRQSFYSR